MPCFTINFKNSDRVAHFPGRLKNKIRLNGDIPFLIFENDLGDEFHVAIDAISCMKIEGLETDKEETNDNKDLD